MNESYYVKTHYKKQSFHWPRWHKPVITALGWLRYDHTFKASLGYIARYYPKTRHERKKKQHNLKSK